MNWDLESIERLSEDPLKDKKIILGVSGSIAAYKSAELVRLLMDRGACIQVVMTKSAEAFVQPLTFQALSGQPVRNTLWDPSAEAAMGHIELARWADIILISPATANIIAKLAQGICDDLLTTLCLATPNRVVVAPAMNQQMWSHSATQSNIQTLRSRDVDFIGPGAGSQACGDWGVGRMSEPQEITDRVSHLAAKPMIKRGRCIITAGPTREPIDPVRFISNHSSGKMGYALAVAAADFGFETTLVTGPVSIQKPYGVKGVNVETANEMLTAVEEQMSPTVDLFIGAAAVSDYRVSHVSEQKIKKGGGAPALSLVENPDVLAEVAKKYPSTFMVGFAAETEKLVENARSKLTRKSLDLIIANDVSEPGLGMNEDDNKVTLIHRSDLNLRATLSLGPQPKTMLARQIMASIIGSMMQEGRFNSS